MGSTSILHRTLSSCTISSQLSGKSGHLARPCLLANCRSNRPRTPSWSRPDARRRYSAANDRPSDKTTDPVRELDTSLEVLPRFRTRGEDVTILQDPRQWKEWLMVSYLKMSSFPFIGTNVDGWILEKKSISDAKDRIFIASLYIGTERTDLVSLSPHEVSLGSSPIPGGFKTVRFKPSTTHYRNAPTFVSRSFSISSVRPGSTLRNPPPR